MDHVLKVIQPLIYGHQSKLDSLLLIAGKPLFTAQSTLINVIYQFWIIFKLEKHFVKLISYVRCGTWKNFAQTSVQLVHVLVPGP